MIRERRQKSHSGYEHGIDLAPMLDFTVNLLIFFIITTSFINRPGTTVAKPSASTAQQFENGKLLIAIRSNGDIWMGGQQVELNDLPAMVQRLHIERPHDTVVIVADKASKAGVVAKVMNKVHAGGINAIAIAANQPTGNG
ncbi:MAG TPA: biopolymer transporter ExbD [Gammaproteobacteria bacterium]|jgi:biopolymer transport protein ExbD|nr:biopolymer transporter ExbD [Gammaproteobacteria bacterium]